MRVFIAVIILIFSLQSWTKADDIRDFEIEGMSIGDSALDYLTVKEINENLFKNYFKNGKKRKYYVTGYFNSNKYDQIEIYIKTGDKKYTIKAITGFKDIKNLKTCITRRNEITDEIKNLFKNIEPIFYDDIPHSFDKSGKSKQYQAGFLLKNDPQKDQIRIECTIWSNKMKTKNQFMDTLGISVFSTETLMWVENGYQ